MTEDLHEAVGALIAAAILSSADDCQECALSKTPEWAEMLRQYESAFGCKCGMGSQPHSCS